MKRVVQCILDGDNVPKHRRYNQQVCNAIIRSGRLELIDELGSALPRMEHIFDDVAIRFLAAHDDQKTLMIYKDRPVVLAAHTTKAGFTVMR